MSQTTDEAAVDAMTDEQVTLKLAREGHSPEDVRRAFELMERQRTEWLEPSRADLARFDDGDFTPREQ